MHMLVYKQRDGHEVMEHPFFADIDFEKLVKREIKPPFAPKLVTCLPSRFRAFCSAAFLSFIAGLLVTTMLVTSTRSSPRKRRVSHHLTKKRQPTKRPSRWHSVTFRRLRSTRPFCCLYVCWCVAIVCHKVLLHTPGYDGANVQTEGGDRKLALGDGSAKKGVDWRLKETGIALEFMSEK